MRRVVEPPPFSKVNRRVQRRAHRTIEFNPRAQIKAQSNAARIITMFVSKFASLLYEFLVLVPLDGGAVASTPRRRRWRRWRRWGWWSDAMTIGAAHYLKTTPGNDSTKGNLLQILNLFDEIPQRNLRNPNLIVHWWTNRTTKGTESRKFLSLTKIPLLLTLLPFAFKFNSGTKPRFDVLSLDHMVLRLQCLSIPSPTLVIISYYMSI